MTYLPLLCILSVAGGIYQDVPTVVGQSYILQFSATGGTWDGGDNNDFGMVSFGPISNERFYTGVGDYQDAYSMGWTTFVYEITATTNPTRLQFFSSRCIEVRA
jgi:hypothetical protein